MQITIKIKLLPTKNQIFLIKDTANEYIKTVNSLVVQMIEARDYLKLSSKNVHAALPSALRCQCVLDAKSIYKRYKKTEKHSILKKPLPIWNNQNYRIAEDYICFPVLINNKSSRIQVKAIITEQHRQMLENKLGTLRITTVNGKLISQIVRRTKYSKCACGCC